jgi:polysaccharide biosynthesis transport protein
MKKARFKNLDDFLALLMRRRWWIIFTTLALCGLSIYMANLFPRYYPSRTRILILPRDVPSDFVKDLIGENTDERLSAIEQTILSRTNILKILAEHENQLPEFRRLNDERKVEKLRKRIQIEFPSEKRRGLFLPTNNILISYRDRNPEMARKITARLASLFIEEDNRARENKVFGTAEFLEAELKKVSEQLRQSEDQLREMKLRYSNELPTVLATNQHQQDLLQIQKNSNLESLDRYMTQQMNLERDIAETSPTVPSDSIGKPVAAPPTVAAKNPLIDAYRKKEQELRELNAKAKPTHPDVRRLTAELEQMKKDIPPEDLAEEEKKNVTSQAAVVMVPNPVYQKLTAQLNQLKTDIEIRQREKKYIDDEMLKYSQRVQNTPRIEQSMAEITRTNGDLKKQHDDLKGKLDSAKLASSLESHQKGAQFEIIDPANYPLEPSPPGPIIILLGGIVASFAVGILAAVVTGGLNQRIWTHQEVERALEAPVLVEIPTIVSPADIRSALRRRLMHAFLFVVFAGVYLGGLYCLYQKQATVLRLLDPLIEQIAERAAG